MLKSSEADFYSCSTDYLFWEFLKIVSVAELYSDIRRYFVKQQKIGLFYLIVESRISQYSLCQQLYL